MLSLCDRQSKYLRVTRQDQRAALSESQLDKPWSSTYRAEKKRTLEKRQSRGTESWVKSLKKKRQTQMCRVLPHHSIFNLCDEVPGNL